MSIVDDLPLSANTKENLMLSLKLSKDKPFSPWVCCSGLTTFPSIDVSSVANIQGVWDGCIGRTTFPALDVRDGRL